MHIISRESFFTTIARYGNMHQGMTGRRTSRLTSRVAYHLPTTEESNSPSTSAREALLGLGPLTLNPDLVVSNKDK